MEPEKTPPGSPVATAEVVDDVAKKLEEEAHVSPLPKAKRPLKSPDKAPRDKAAAQKTTANPNDRGIFKASPMKPPAAGDEDGAAAATPAEPVAAAEEEDEEVLEDAPPPPPPRQAVVNMSDDDDADDEVMQTLRRALERTEREKADGLKGEKPIREFYNEVLGEEFGLEGFGISALKTSLGLRRRPNSGKHLDCIIAELKRRIRERPQKRTAELAEAARAAAAVPAPAPAPPADQNARPMSVSAQAAKDALAALGGTDVSALAITFADAAASREKHLTEESLVRGDVVFSWTSSSPSTRVRPLRLSRVALVPNLGDASPGARFARILHACYRSVSCLCRAVRRPVAAADLALLARGTPEGRAPPWIRVLDARHPFCCDHARATPPLLGPRFDPNDDRVAATVAFLKAAAYDVRSQTYLEECAFIRDVEAGTATITMHDVKRIRKLVCDSPLSRDLGLGMQASLLRATEERSLVLQWLDLCAPYLNLFARDDRIEEKFADNYDQYLRECDAAGQAARAPLSREGHLEALCDATTKLLAADDDMTTTRFHALVREARTEVGVQLPRGTGTIRERAVEFQDVLGAALAALPAEVQVEAHVEAYASKWESTQDSDLVRAAHRTTILRYPPHDPFVFDPSLWNDAAVAARDASLREHYAEPQSDWASHRGRYEPGLFTEDPPSNLREGPAFHADHWEPETAEDIARTWKE